MQSVDSQRRSGEEVKPTGFSLHENNKSEEEVGGAGGGDTVHAQHLGAGL